MKMVVTDTGPLLHLMQIGLEDLLSHFGEVHVTHEVLFELRRHWPQGMDNLPAWLIVASPSSSAASQASHWHRAGLLHAGESEAIAFAHEIEADLLLSDDAAARVFAEGLGIQVRGSVGIVLYAAALQQISKSEALKCLDLLQSSSTLWVSTKVLAAAKQALQQMR